jgi:hypothetical protein
MIGPSQDTHSLKHLLLTQLKRMHFNPYYKNHLITQFAYFPNQTPRKSIESNNKTKEKFIVSHFTSKKAVLMIEYPVKTIAVLA